MQQRQCVILQGEQDWCQTSAKILLAKFDHKKQLVISQNKAQSQLGKEFDAVVCNTHEQAQLNPDSLGAILGTITAGGVLILLLPDLAENSLWMQRFNQISAYFSSHYTSFTVVKQGDDLPKLSSPKHYEQSQTKDQQLAIQAILKVVQGHRRRPLVLSSDRGRGKSAALGIAAAALIKQGKQRIIITAPSLATADTVFKHVTTILSDPDERAKITFIAPDVLIASDEKADCVLVDEAAAIPTSMLEQLLQKQSRIVFATTLHGYEGTGRGFAVRFQKTLDKKTPNWNSLRMETPIRWQQGDILEAFSFQALLLDAIPAQDDLISEANTENCIFEHIDRKQLINDEQSLRELFGLMVLAHYRTRPSDLQMMLDRDDITVYALRYQGHIVASAWLVQEGELDDELATDIHAGKRRLKGHLLPQSLLAHAGITTAGSLCYQRIIRIAVHPTIQQRGLGEKLLQQIVEQSEKQNDIIGASFGITSDLLRFWTNAGFAVARLGIHKDDVSGSHAVMMLRSTSAKGQHVLNDVTQRFQQQWSSLLQTHFKQLDPDIVIAISQTLPQQQAQLSIWDKQDIQAFATGQRGFEFSVISLRLLLGSLIRQTEFLQLSEQQKYLCVMAILQQGQWEAVAKLLGYTGKKQIISDLRDAVRILMVDDFL
ncbi:MAG: tRNA(Met) cytidine acetyltransferase [Piscirickettsiaceae bacterium]|nr:tRNA(Met) cytidine acetyltransferase [Piscirickettsiaceae bacterium]